MKRIVIFLLMGLFLVMTDDASAQPRARHKAIAKNAIRRTAVVIRFSHKKLKEGKVFTGDFLKAVRHQRYARALYLKGRYGRAYWHTRRARQLAFMVIKANKGAVDKSWEVGKDETISDENQPSDEELDKELPNANYTEEELVNGALEEIDLNADE